MSGFFMNERLKLLSTKEKLTISIQKSLIEFDILAIKHADVVHTH